MGQNLEYELDRYLDTIHGRICFPQTMKVYAPTCYGKCDDTVQRLATDLAKHFGGVTVYDKVGGCWVDPNGDLECEPVKVIEIGHDCASREDLMKLSSAIVRYGQEARQDSIGIKGGNFYVAKSAEMLQRHLLESLKEELPG
jgi:hypothetical protein